MATLWAAEGGPSGMSNGPVKAQPGPDESLHISGQRVPRIS